MKKNISYLFILILFSSSIAQKKIEKECFMVMVGKRASSDGSVLIAHNNDLTGIEASLLEKISKDPSYNDSIYFSSGLFIPPLKQNNELLLVRTFEGFEEGDATAISESMVSIGGGVALGSDRDSLAAKIDTLVSEGLTGGIRYYALQQASSARELVKLIGSHYTKYGVTYPSGIAIADTSEIWYMESGGGRTWAAVRVPDTSCMVVANGYQIGKINFNDTLHFLTSPKLLEFCKENNLVDSTSITINFAKVFGGGRENRFYDTRRVWRGISLLDSNYVGDYNRLEFPMFFQPNNKVSVNDLFRILRDTYGKTKFSPDSTSGERLISSRNTVHTEVVQLNGTLPKEIGSILWCGLSDPKHTVYLPFYFGIKEIPHKYSIGDEDEDLNSAFWQFKKLSDKLYNMKAEHYHKFVSILRSFEQRVLQNQQRIIKAFTEMNGKSFKKANEILNNYYTSLAKNANDVVSMLYKEILKLEL